TAHRPIFFQSGPPAAAVAAGGPDWKKIGLWAVLLLGVLALAGMAFSMLRKPAA
ncbi:DUF3999 family protein, partial [Pseudomonas protegens]|uniref:DUF3999 family protein n=1 Tax=Pseudomonas protegens TaxID=380021 RepID=UPI001B31D7DD|nr:DUF3999 family protein [Pseudomonas protegens]